MAMNDLSSDNAPSPVAKKPYEKPAFRFEQVFVTTALNCSKIGGTQGNCKGITGKAS